MIMVVVFLNGCELVILRRAFFLFTGTGKILPYLDLRYSSFNVDSVRYNVVSTVGYVAVTDYLSHW
jgi:hypothetical protein